ncbi:enoyl-CoA hydratase/isomerase family protein [Chloroflexota bacterium]
MPRDYSAYKNLIVEVDEDGVATVTLNRPHVLNAQNYESRLELNTIWDDLELDEDVKVIIFTGAGRGFCAGGDIKEVAERHAKGELSVVEAQTTQPRSNPGLHYTAKMLNLPKIIIGAINGVATGQGCVMALYCDIVIAADTASFGDHHIRVGLVPGDGGTILWPLLVGPHKTMEYLVTGDLMDAQEADKRGLVNKVVPLADLMLTARTLAKRIAHGPTIAIGLTKRAINKKIKQDYNLIMDFALSSEGRTINTEDHHEAASAFVEKREPEFKGR